VKRVAEATTISRTGLIQQRIWAVDGALRAWAGDFRGRRWLYEGLRFTAKQAWACLFGALMLALLTITHRLWPTGAPLARYDFMVIAAVLIQAGMLAFRLERPQEALVIAVFHVTGTLMEIYKIAHGSWSYPEASVLRIAGVPLFSGFMYASVGSYMARATRLFHIRFFNYPPLWTTWALALAAYVNFFTHHYLPDIRLVLFAASVLIFWRTSFDFTPERVRRRMPMLPALLGVAFCIWLAENIATGAMAWIYPSQRNGWHMVPITKMGSWYLLMMLSFVLVTVVHPPVRAAQPAQPAAGRRTRLATAGMLWTLFTMFRADPPPPPPTEQRLRDDEDVSGAPPRP
jgi:uncharacterized membrane protein YoaT (DUF817 family)